MGKHSSNSGFFRKNPSDKGGPQPANRRVPSRTAGKKPLTVADAQRAAASKDPRGRLSDPGKRREGALERAPQRLRAERDRRSNRAKRIAMIVGASLVVALVVGAGGLYAYAKHIERTMQRTVVKQEKLDIELAKAKPQEPYNMLILGVDKRAKDKVYRSDTIVLARIDPKTKQVWMVSIPRDTRAQIPGHGHGKINAAYALGEEQLAIDSVQKLTGVPINHFMAIDFSGFAKVVDAMGGVWIDVPEAINDRQADGTKDKSASRIDAGYQLLDGDHALTFVRARHQFADQDFSRMKNQQAFVKAIAEQMATKTSVAKLPGIVSAVAPHVSTDMSLLDMLRTAQALRGGGGDNVYTTTLPGKWKSPYIWPDEEAKTKIIAKLEAGEPFKKKKSAEQTATVEPEQAAEVSTKDPAKVTVTVRNGAGIPGCANQAASILKARAFKVKEVGNANQFVYDKTLVVYAKDKPAAQLVLQTLPPGTKLVESRGMYAFDTDILVVVGKDWDLSKVPVTPIKTN